MEQEYCIVIQKAKEEHRVQNHQQWAANFSATVGYKRLLLSAMDEQRTEYRKVLQTSEAFDSMAQIANISEQVQLKSNGHEFYQLMKKKMDSLTQMFPENLKSYEIVQGNGFAHGSIIHWKYDFGTPTEAKARLIVDESNKTISYKFLEGELFKDFEMFEMKAQVIDGGNNGVSSVKWSVNFVKANEDVPPPYNYVQFGVKLIKGLDANLCNN